MDAGEVRTRQDAQRIVEERGLSHVKIGVFDLDGVLRGKYISRAKFLSALAGGMGFCDVVLGWDTRDQLYDNVSFTGWHSGYPDAEVRLLPGSVRPARRLGLAKGDFEIGDEFFEPLPDDLLDAFEEKA